MLTGGVYTISEAARYTKVSPQRIRRWVGGYSYVKNGSVKNSSPLWKTDYNFEDNIVALSFLDLVEIIMVDAFRKHFVSWKAIREAANIACDMFENDHPFSLKSFFTDGKRIFSEIEQENKIKLFDLNQSQYVGKEIISRSLLSSVDFEDGQAARWYPKIGRRKVVLDPERSFGQPVLSKEGIPTAILAHAVKIEESYEEVANWYEIPVSSVKNAVNFEKQLAA